MLNQPTNYGGRALSTGTDPRSRQMRMQEWENYITQNPGAAAGGTGSTGLTSSDHSGWSYLLDRQKQYADDSAAIQGKAGPSVRFAGYDGSGVLAPQRRGGNVPNAALKGLSSAIGGDRDRGRLPQIIGDDPELYSAYKNSLLDEFQGNSRVSQRQGLDPGMRAYEALDARRRYGVEDEQLDRDQDYADIDNTADARADSYFRHTEPVDRRRNELAGELARDKGEAAAYDDAIRADAARYGADQRLTGTQYTADQRTQQNLLSELRKLIGGSQQYGDPNDARTKDLSNRFDQLSRPGTSQGAAPQGPQGGRIVGKTYRNSAGQLATWDGTKMVPK